MYVEDVEDGVCSLYGTLHTELLILLLMLKVSKMSNTMNNFVLQLTVSAQKLMHHFEMCICFCITISFFLCRN